MDQPKSDGQSSTGRKGHIMNEALRNRTAVMVGGLILLCSSLAVSKRKESFYGDVSSYRGLEFHLSDWTSVWRLVNCEINVSANEDFADTIATLKTRGLSMTGGSVSESMSREIKDRGHFKLRFARSLYGEKVNFEVSIVALFENAGIYYIRRVFWGTGLDGVEHRYSGHWKIIVREPVIITPFTLDSLFYFAETKSFSFACQGYDSLGLYSYAVLLGNDKGGKDTIKTGLGSYVNLDSILSNVEYVGQNLLVEGYYSKRKFKYEVPGTSKVDSTSWRFTVLKPEMLTSYMLEWAEGRDFDEGKRRPLIYIDCRNNSYTCRFRYIYITQKDNSIIATRPEIYNCRIISRPSDFLVPTSPAISRDYLGSTVQITPNPNFLSSNPPGEPSVVELEISFNTQFEPVKRVYRVYKAFVH